MAIKVKIIDDPNLFNTGYGSFAIVLANGRAILKEGFPAAREAFKYLLKHNQLVVDYKDKWSLIW